MQLTYVYIPSAAAKLPTYLFLASNVISCNVLANINADTTHACLPFVFLMHLFIFWHFSLTVDSLASNFDADCRNEKIR